MRGTVRDPVMDNGFEEMWKSLEGFSDDFMEDWDADRLEDKRRFLVESQELEEQLSSCFGKQDTD